MGLAALPAGDQGGHVVGQLEGGVELGPLAVSRPGGLVLALGVFRQEPGGLGNLDARFFPQAEHDEILPEGFHLHAVAQLREKVVAGVGNGPGDVQVSVARGFPALGVAVDLVLGVTPDAGVLDFLRQGGVPVEEGRHGGEGLQGGARGVLAHGGPVEHGAAQVLGELADVLAEGSQ